MKKRKIKNLSLKKRTVSNLNARNIKGGLEPVAATHNDCRSCDGKCNSANGGITCLGSLFCKSKALKVCNSIGVA